MYVNSFLKKFDDYRKQDIAHLSSSLNLLKDNDSNRWRLWGLGRLDENRQVKLEETNYLAGG